jgi:hypothetical protein
VQHLGVIVRSHLGAPGEFFVMFALVLLAVMSVFSGSSRLGLLFAVVAGCSGTYLHFYG